MTATKYDREVLTLKKKPVRSEYPQKTERRADRLAMLKRLNRKGGIQMRKAFPDDDEQFTKDVAVLWAAYVRGAFSYWGEGLTKEQFQIALLDNLGEFHNAIMIDDFNKLAGGDYAPVGIMLEHFDGWKLKPHVEWFPWASPRNKLRGVVNYLRGRKLSNEVGVLIVECTPREKYFYNHVCKYGYLFGLHKIKHGWPDSDMLVYWVTCNGGYERQVNESKIEE